jgi:hypothetical protein
MAKRVPTLPRGGTVRRGAHAQSATALCAGIPPQERLWKWLRRVGTHDHWFETLQEERQAIRDFFCSLAGRQDDIRQLCAIKTRESLVALR